MRGTIGAIDVSHYDLVLAVIPSVFALAVLVDAVLAVPSAPAFAAASVIGAIVLADALFLNPPTPDGDSPTPDDE